MKKSTEDIIEQALEFELSYKASKTRNEKIIASRKAKEIVLAINEIYKETKEYTLMDIMKRITVILLFVCSVSFGQYTVTIQADDIPTSPIPDDPGDDWEDSVEFLKKLDSKDSIFYFKDTLIKMEEYGLTFRPKLLLYASVFLLISGSFLVLIGYRSGLGAILLLLYWIPLTFIIHSWWNDPVEIQREQAVMFMKNLAIAGGLLVVVVNGSGRWSIKRIFATTKVPTKRF